MEQENKIGGVIYPLNENNYVLLKQRKKPIFIKFLPHSNSKNPTKLCPGNYLLFYLSKQNKSIIGYSKINDIFFKTPTEINQQYIDEIQMDKIEFERYVKNRENKPLMVLILDRIIDFKKKISIDYPITMTGKYISKDELKCFIK